MRLLIAVVAVWAILFVVPFAIYGSASSLLDLKPVAGPAWRFLAGVAITKLGTAVAFVALFYISRSLWRGQWIRYAAIWFVTFAASELGDALRTASNSIEATLGILSEAIYAPASAFTIDWLFRRTQPRVSCGNSAEMRRR